jgi:hypothetical protein
LTAAQHQGRAPAGDQQQHQRREREPALARVRLLRPREALHARLALLEGDGVGEPVRGRRGGRRRDGHQRHRLGRRDGTQQAQEIVAQILHRRTVARLPRERALEQRLQHRQLLVGDAGETLERRQSRLQQRLHAVAIGRGRQR